MTPVDFDPEDLANRAKHGLSLAEAADPDGALHDAGGGTGVGLPRSAALCDRR